MTVVRLAAMVALTTVLTGAGTAWAGAPTDQLRGRVDRVLRVLEDPALKTEARTAERRATIRAHRLRDLRLPRARRSARWPATGRAADAAERDEFIQLFADLLERSYIGKIETYSGGERIQYAGETLDGEQATVRTRIVTKAGTEIPVDYRMHRVRRPLARLRRGHRGREPRRQLPRPVQQDHPGIVLQGARRPSSRPRRRRGSRPTREPAEARVAEVAPGERAGPAGDLPSASPPTSPPSCAARSWRSAGCSPPSRAAATCCSRTIPGTGKTTLAKALARSIGAQLQARAVHARPAAVRHPRRLGLRPARPGVPLPRGPDLHAHPARRRDQPRLAAHAVGAARGDGARARSRVDGTHLPRCDELFFVIATQNPVEFRGTYPLPEAQMDRFALQFGLGYVDAEEEVGDPLGAGASAIRSTTLARVRRRSTTCWRCGERVREVRVSDELKRYVVDLVRRDARRAPAVQLGRQPARLARAHDGRAGARAASTARRS